jgi:hypothetical protein
MNNIFKSEVSVVLPSLVAPVSWQDDGIVGQISFFPALLSMWITVMPFISALGAA